MAGGPTGAAAAGGGDGEGAAAAASSEFAADAADTDGTASLLAASELRFCSDRRLDEASALLRTSIPLRLRATVGADGAENGDAMPPAEQQAQLLVLASRALALPIGRGALTLGSVVPIATEPLRIPPLLLTGLAPPNGATVSLDATALPAEAMLWPEFHNAVAAALRYEPSPLLGGERMRWPAQSTPTPPGGGGDGDLGRAWIAYSRPDLTPHAQAGMLLGLGLQGHLLTLASTDLYRYMSHGHDVTMMSLLLGTAAARRRTMHAPTAKVLALHIPALHPPSFTELELEVPPIVQVAALVGVGLLYEGSAHRLMVEVALSQIGRAPTNELLQHREAYALAAGLMLGLLALGRGTDTAGLADLTIEDQLGKYIHGGSLVPAGGNGSGGGGGGSGEGGGGGRAARASGAANRCCRMLEGTLVNTNVTAPGATLALGLAFLKTGNKSAAEQLRAPSTHYELERVRPDCVQLRVLARALVLWHDVTATGDWLNEQMPLLLRGAFDSKLPAGGGQDEEDSGMRQDVDWVALRMAHVHALAGACTAIGLRYAGTAHRGAHALLTAQVKRLHVLRSTAVVGGGRGCATPAEAPAIESCLGSVTLALSCVMAGTGHLDTLRLLRVLRARLGPVGGGGEALAHHSTHTALSMATGILFLGGGRWTLSRSNSAIAALVCALYPQMPTRPSDNRYHLQALRHLYVLAAEPRCLDAFDVDSGAPCLVPIEVDVYADEPGESLGRRIGGGGDDEGGESEGDKGAEGEGPQPLPRIMTLRKVAPCLLPELHRIVAIRVLGPRHWPLELDVQNNGAHALAVRRRRLFVKRKGGHLPYIDDPRALRSLLCRPFASIATQLEKFASKRGAASLSDGSLTQTDAAREAHLVAFGADVELLAFARHYCVGTSDRAAFCSGVLFECLAKGTPEMALHYLALWRTAELAGGGGGIGALEMRALRLLLAYHEGDAPRRLSDPDADPLLQRAFLASLRVSLECALQQPFFKAEGGASVSSRTFALHGKFSEVSRTSDPLDEAVRHYLRTVQLPSDPQLCRRVGEVLAFHRLPALAELQALEQSLAARAPRSHAGWLLAARAALPHTPTQTLIRLARLYELSTNE